MSPIPPKPIQMKRRKYTLVTMRTRGLLLATSLLVLASTTAAHEIPADVLVQLFVKPQAAAERASPDTGVPAGGVLNVLVRVPLATARDIVFPTIGPGYLHISRAEPQLRTAAALWIAGGLVILEDDMRLAPPRVLGVRVSLPSDRSFTSYDQALAHIGAPPLADDTELVWNQALLDVHLAYPIRSEHSKFAIEPALARLGLRVVTTLQFQPPGGAARVLEYRGDPGLVRLDPSWRQAAARFVTLGFEHILGGIDHLLFLFCLVIPFLRLAPLALVVTSFTVAHSITLAASAMDVAPGGLWFPPLIETLIAMSIVYMALENIVVCMRGPAEVEAPSLTRRWIVTFVFGLVHGFGFSFALRETLQFAGPHVWTSLLAFNLGVEIGQLIVIVALVPSVHALFRFVVPARVGTILLSALAAHTAWHWMTERLGILGQFGWPRPELADLVILVRILMAVVAIAGVAWWLRSRRGTAEAGQREPAGLKPDPTTRS